MGCINDKDIKINKLKRLQYQSKYRNSLNPIVRIAKQWNVELIKQRWHDNQLDVIESKLGPNSNKISKERFIYLLPELKNLSQTSQNSFYNLFNYQEEDLLTLDNFITTLIIILKSDDDELLADMFFFTYSSSAAKDVLSQKDFNLFQKQFKEHQLQFLHQTKKPQKSKNGQINVQKKLFRQIFQQYDLKTIKTLFRFNLRDQQKRFQRNLAASGINRENKQQVFLIDFKWFMKWKNYIQLKYGIKIQIKDNGKSLEEQKMNLLMASAKQNQNQRNSKRQSINLEASQYLQPVNNQRIQGQDPNQLKENLIEFSDFISVPTSVWQQIRILYGGGPEITKPYPHFYNKRIVLTILEQNKCRFHPKVAKAIVYHPKQTFEDIYKNRQSRYFPKKDQVADMIVYYKHPGQLEWKKIQKLNIKLEDFPFKFKAFIVFVKSDTATQFQSNFNISEVKGKKQIKERIKNYGSLLTFEYEGILQQGHVGVIMEHSVVLYLKNSKGQYLKIQKTCKQLNKLNENILEQHILQGFAGLQNIGNTCYINAPLQCLLRTPYFDEYLNLVNLDKNRNDMLIYQLQCIHDQGKRSRDCVSMSNFKKKFDQRFPFFEGSAQHDAQEFLILLLDKLSQEQPRQSLIGNNQIQTKKNKRIHSFFSGKTKAQTQCINCHKRGGSEQSFFTYSLSLPIINQALFNFYYIDSSYKVHKYGLTINKDCEVEQLIKKIQNALKTTAKNLLIMNVFESQWMDSLLTLYSSYKVANLQHYDTKIVCYPIKNTATPDYEDICQGSTKNSAKIQIRNRIFDQKSNSFKSFYFPFFIQIDHKMTGKQLRQIITAKAKTFVNYEEYNTFKQIQDEKVDSKTSIFDLNSPRKSIRSTSSFKSLIDQDQQINHMRRNSKKRITDLPFTIQYLKNEDNMKSNCWFCKKNVDYSDTIPNPKNDCEGCEFPDEIPLYENKIFMRNFKNLVVTIDWKSQIFTKNWTIEETQSFTEAQRLEGGRRSNLQFLLKQAYEQEQRIQLRCEAQRCQSKFAIRKQRIHQPPNILILHLKRFYYKDNTFYKLNNKVDIPQEFSLPGFGMKYELYGNVVHYGSGTGRGGHYINYLRANSQWFRCDDQKVHFTKQPSQHLHPDTYLLFYKQKSMEKSLGIFGF